MVQNIKKWPHPSYQHFKGNPINYLERRLIISTLRNKVFTTFALKQPVIGWHMVTREHISLNKFEKSIIDFIWTRINSRWRLETRSISFPFLLLLDALLQLLLFTRQLIMTALFMAVQFQTLKFHCDSSNWKDRHPWRFKWQPWLYISWLNAIDSTKFTIIGFIDQF